MNAMHAKISSDFEENQAVKFPFLSQDYVMSFSGVIELCVWVISCLHMACQFFLKTPMRVKEKKKNNERGNDGSAAGFCEREIE